MHASFGAHGKSTQAGAADDVMLPLYIIHFTQYTCMFMYVYLIAVFLEAGGVRECVFVLFGCVIKCYYEMALGPIFIMRYLVYALVRVSQSRRGACWFLRTCLGVCAAASVWQSMLPHCGLFVCLRRFCGCDKIYTYTKHE